MRMQPFMTSRQTICCQSESDRFPIYRVLGPIDVNKHRAESPCRGEPEERAVFGTIPIFLVLICVEKGAKISYYNWYYIPILSSDPTFSEVRGRMMKLIVDCLLYSPVPEFLVMTLFMFSLFRLPIKSYIPHIVFLCLVMSYFAYTVRQFGIVTAAPSLQMLLFTICVWLLFRLHVFHALIIGITAYHGYIVIQVPLMLVMDAWGFWSLADGTGSEWVQLASVIVCGLITWIIRRYQLGFTFVQENATKKIVMNKYNVAMLVIALSDIALEGIFLVLYRTKIPVLLLVLSLVQFSTMLFFIYYSLRKEQKAH